MPFDAPRLIDRLEAFPTLLRALVSDTRGAEWTWRPEEGSWAVVEILGHLLREEREDFRVRLGMTLRSPEERWPGIDPESAVAEQRDIELDPGRVLNEFVRERGASVTWLRSLGAVSWGATHEHPSLGPIRAGDLLAAWADHDTLHARQIVKRRHQLTVRDSGGYSCRYAGSWTA